MIRPVNRRLSVRWLSACCLVLAGCAEAPEPVPTPPATAELVAQFDTVTGALDAASAEALVEGLVGDLVVIAAAIALVTEVDAAREDVEGAEVGTGALTAQRTAQLTASSASTPTAPPLGTQRAPLTADAGGWARLTYICPGLDREVVDPGNGKLVLRTVLEDIDTEWVLWGDALACIVDSGTDEGFVTLDAAVLAHYIVDADALYARLDGALRDPTGDAPFTLDLVQDPFGVRLYRVVDAGSFVLGFDGLDGVALEDGAVTVLDRGGLWRCTYQNDALSGRCVQGDRVLQWP